MPDYKTIKIRMTKSINTARTPKGSSTLFRHKGETHAVWPDLAHALVRAKCAKLVDTKGAADESVAGEEVAPVGAEGGAPASEEKGGAKGPGTVPDSETEGGAEVAGPTPAGDEDVKVVELVKEGGAPGGKKDPVALGESVEAVVKSDDGKTAEKIVAPKDVALEMVARGGGLFDIHRADTGAKLNAEPMKKVDAQAILDNSTNE